MNKWRDIKRDRFPRSFQKIDIPRSFEVLIDENFRSRQTRETESLVEEDRFSIEFIYGDILISSSKKICNEHRNLLHQHVLYQRTPQEF